MEGDGGNNGTRSESQVRPFSFRHRVDCYHGCWLCSLSTLYYTSNTTSSEFDVIRGCPMENTNLHLIRLLDKVSVPDL